MWYLANLYFDYEEYRAELKALSDALDKGDPQPLRKEVKRVVTSGEFDHIFSRYGYGKILPMPSIRRIETSPYRNSILGSWLFIITAKYLEPTQECLGYDWRIVAESLEGLSWSKQEINLLINGSPMAKLLGKDSVNHTVVEHGDPYWEWIRPSYSYNQGGWISMEECEKFFKLLQKTLEKDLGDGRHFNSGFLANKNETWVYSLTHGIKSLLSILNLAIDKGCGIYSAIYWDWADSDE